MLAKILILLLSLALLYYLYRRSRTTRKLDDEEQMHPCHRCGTYVSQHDAIHKDGHLYCSKECAQ
ncbi:MAG: Prokaryotic metallothionein [Campylobacterales bacterium]